MDKEGERPVLGLSGDVYLFNYNMFEIFLSANNNARYIFIYTSIRGPESIQNVKDAHLTASRIYDGERYHLINIRKKV